jgi:hypothetical protein
MGSTKNIMFFIDGYTKRDSLNLRGKRGRKYMARNKNENEENNRGM